MGGKEVYPLHKIQRQKNKVECCRKRKRKNERKENMTSFANLNVIALTTDV